MQKVAERDLSPKRALITLEGLLSDPDESKSAKAIEDVILKVSAKMKDSVRRLFLRDATILIAESDLSNRDHLLQLAVQRWAENDAEAVSAWAASSKEEIAGMAVLSIGQAMANWSPEQAADRAKKWDGSDSQSNSALSLTALSTEHPPENRPAWEASSLHESDPEPIQATIARVMPPWFGHQADAAGAETWAQALSENPLGDDVIH